MVSLTDRLIRYVETSFGEPMSILGRLESLRVPLEGHPSERVLAAVVLASGGDADRFESMHQLAEIDWRDVLVAAGLEHENWPSILNDLLGPG